MSCRHFNASPDEYMVIFTQNATGALKLDRRVLPFGPGDTYFLTFDNHNSVNGIREFAVPGEQQSHISPFCSRLARRRGPAGAGPGDGTPGNEQSIRLSGSVQFNGRATPA